MPIETRKWITRQMLQDEPDTLFCFGDNLEYRGLGGQAKEMRGEPNAVGIPTKVSPSNRPSAFFTDNDLEAFRAAAYAPLKRLLDHLRAGGTVVWPEDDIGAGLADLPNRAPAIWHHLQRCKDYLWSASCLNANNIRVRD